MHELFSKLPEDINIIYLPLLFLTMLVHYLLEPLRWYFYTLKAYQLDYNRMFSIFSITALVTYILPVKMGIPIRIFLLRTKAGLNFVPATSILMLDGAINYSCWAIAAIMSISIFIKSDAFNNSFLYIPIILILILTVLFLFKNRKKILSINTERNINKGGIRHLIANIDLNIIFKSLMVMPVDIMAHVLHHWAIFYLLGIELDFSTVFIITTISVFTGLISMMPMGLGGYDGMLIFLLTQYSIGPEHAISIAIINRLSSFFISVFTGVYGGAQLGLNPFKTNWKKLVFINSEKNY